MVERREPYKNDAFKLILENLSASDVSLTLFDISNSDSQQNYQYRFSVPYVSDYFSYKFTLTVDGSVKPVVLVATNPCTPQQAANLMTSTFGVGTWYVETEIGVSNTFYINSTSLLTAVLKVQTTNYSPAIKNVIGGTQVAVSGLVSYQDICESLVGSVYPLNYISIYSSNLQQVTGTFQFVRKNITGNQSTKTINSEIDRYQRMYKTDVDMRGKQLDIESTIDITVLANSTVELNFHHAGVFLGCEIIQVEREREFLNDIFENIDYSEIGL